MSAAVLPSMYPFPLHSHSPLKENRSPPTVPLHTRPKFPKLPLSSATVPPAPLHRRVHSSSIVQSLSSQANTSPYSPNSGGQSPQLTPRFHLSTEDMTVFSHSPTASPSHGHWTVHSPHGSPHRVDGQGVGVKPPSPPLNHTNTFHRPVQHQPLNHDREGLRASAPTPVPSSAPPPLLSSVLAASKVRAVPHLQSVEPSRAGDRELSRSKQSRTRQSERRHRKTHSSNHSGSLSSGSSGSGVSSETSTPSPPPPSPSSDKGSQGGAFSPLRTPTLPPPSAALSPSSGAAGRTTSLPVAPHTQPVRASLAQSVSNVTAAAFVHPPPAAPPAVALLHASYVYVRTQATLLSRWQKKWLQLSQCPAPSTSYRLALHHKPGDAQAIDAFIVLPTSHIIPSDPERKPCRVKIQVTAERVLSIDTLTPADRTQWLLSLQQAILLTQHSTALTVSTQAVRPLTFPASPSPTHNSAPSALSPFQAFFFHLYYNLPEVGYLHTQYDHAMQQFKTSFPHHNSILTFLLEHLPEEEKAFRDTKADDDLRATHPYQLNVNETAITAWLSTTFNTTSLPALLLHHSMATAHPGSSSGSTSTTASPFSILTPNIFSTGPNSVLVDSLNQTQLLVPNHVVGVPSLPSAAAGSSQQKFEQKLHSPATLHHLSPLLYSSSPLLSALAFRLLWLLMSNVYPPALTAAIFSAHLQRVTPAVQGSEEMLGTMKALLWSPTLHLLPGLVGLRTPFLRPYVLPALLTVLIHASFALRADVLKDISSCLLNPQNVGALASIPQWQTLLFTLLTDLHYSVVRDIGGIDRRDTPDPDEGEEVELSVGGVVEGKMIWHEDVTCREDYVPQRSVYQFVHNIFAVVHYRQFLVVSSFPTLFASTLDQLFTFGGPRVATQRTAVLLLHTLLNLIERNVTKRLIMTSCDQHSTEWKNFHALLTAVKVYVFLCHHWIATDTDTSTYLTPTSNVRMALYQCKFRHPGFVPFAHLMSISGSSSSDTLGVHFDEEGAAADAPLVQRVLGIMQELGLDQPPSNVGYNDADKHALQVLHGHFCFFDSALDFLSTLQARLQSNDSLPIKLLKDAVVQFIDEEAKRVKDANTNKVSRYIRKTRGKDSQAIRSRGGSMTDMSIASTTNSPHNTPSRRRSSARAVCEGRG